MATIPWNTIQSLMAQLLEKVFAKAARLPAAAQKQLAAQMLEDLDGEIKWDKTLINSQPLLEQMASAARQAQRRGKTTVKGFDAHGRTH
jgi:formate dehydrogenase maturation protein FdhE